MFSDDAVIRVESLSKCHQIYEQPSDRLKSFLMPRLRRWFGQPPKAYCREFWALRDVSFDVDKGETVGILGRNGAGKSTLLQLICGTLSPTGGVVETRGRVAALLELGSGFNPDFTGRDNVYMNAALLGLTKQETDARYDAIIEFADIGDFVDQPVKTYSSGMMVRLAFAVQAQVEPDILIVDEALAVGDAKFQAKCFERLRQLKNGGTSVLLVTHSSDQIVTHCDRALLLEQGAVIEVGQPKRVVNSYLDMLFGTKRRAGANPSTNASENAQAHAAALKAKSEVRLNFIEDVFSSHPGYNPHEYRWGDGAAKINDFHLTAESRAYPAQIETGQRVSVELAVRFMNEVAGPIFGVTIKTKEGITVYGANSEILELQDLPAVGLPGEVARVCFAFDCRLAPGDYFISLGVASRQEGEVVPHDRRYDAIHLVVAPVTSFFGIVDLGLELRVGDIEE